jgi:selenocysteine-specific elongation factor
VRRFVLGTAGHVDHGKTTLVRALTGVDTDRLPEEKKRGITIELGFAPWSLGDGLEVSLIDVPGHRRFVHAMIAGAIGMEVVLLVVAADEGVMPQTREHVAACELLGIKRAVVAVTKLDRVGAELASLAADEAMELLAGRFEAEAVACSARTGEGIEAVREAVRRALLKLGPPRPSGRARLSVDRVFSVKGAGTVVTGTLVEGKIAVGAPLFLAGSAGALATAARGLHVHDRAVTIAEAPTRLAVNLAGLALEQVHRGDVLTDDAGAKATRVIDVALRGNPTIRRGMAASVHVGTARSPARVSPLGEPVEIEAPPAPAAATPTRAAKKAFAPPPVAETIRFVRLRLGEPIVVLGGDRFVLRGSDVDGPSGAVIGGGIVLDADPPLRRPREKRRAALLALSAGDPASVMRALVDEAAPRPLARDALGSRFPVAAEALRKIAESLSHKGEIVAIKGHGWLTAARLADLAATARRLVAEHHKKAPLDRGLPLETLRQKLAATSGAEAAEEAIRVAVGKPAGLKTEAIEIDGDVARLASFGGAPVVGAAGDALDAAARLLRDAALRGVSEFAVKEATRVGPREVKAILAKLTRDNLAVHTGELWFWRASFDDLRLRVLAHLAGAPRLTIADFKAISGLGRKQAIVLLEQLDREGVTRREGDDRLRAG